MGESRRTATKYTTLQESAPTAHEVAEVLVVAPRNHQLPRLAAVTDPFTAVVVKCKYFAL